MTADTVSHRCRAVLDLLAPGVAESVGDVWKMHSLILSGFDLDPDAPGRASINQLHALRRGESGEVELLIQADQPIRQDWIDRYALPGSSRQWTEDHQFERGSGVAVQLAASATRAQYRNPGERSRRFPVRGEEGLTRWASERMGKVGLSVDPEAVHIASPTVRLSGKRPWSRRRIVVDQTVFQFGGSVEDPDRFAEACRFGVGSGKAFGCGLVLAL